MQAPIHQVLVAEGNAQDAQLVQQMMREIDAVRFELERADSLEETLGYLRESCPDVVLLGVDRVEEQGLDALAQIQDHCPGIPMIVLTRDDDQAAGLQAIRAGAQDCLIKGQFTREQLVRTMCYAMERKTAERGQAGALDEFIRASDALRENEERYQLLFETMAQGVVYQRADGTISSANPAAERILGVTLDQMQGRTSFDPRWRAVQEDTTEFPGEEHPAMVALATGKPVENAVMGVFHPAQEEWCWIEISAIPQFRAGDSSPYQVYTTFRDVTQYRKSQEQLQASLREKEILLQEIHHRVKNNLQVISSLLELQAASLKDPESVRAFEESQNRIMTIGLIHEKLYREADLSSIGAPDYFQDLLDQLFRLYTVTSRPVSISLNCAPVALTIGAAIPCGLIINELVSNALKHAFPPDRTGDGEIQVSLQKEGSDRLVLTTRDNGIGLPPGQSLSNAQTLGLRLVKLLVQQLGGTLTIDRDTGTAFAVAFDTGWQAVSDGGTG